MTQDETKLSAVEGIKLASQGLAGRLAEDYASDISHFEEAEVQLLKTHGSYQQDDRDKRAELKRAKLDKAWSFMVRARIPGGRMTADQYLAFDKISDLCADGRMRITTRQGIQFHFIGKDRLKPLIKLVADCGLTTLGACGDVNRNTMACPVSDLDWRRDLGMEKLARDIAFHFAPRSTAYWEIWCDGEKWGEQITPDREEPLYGKTYMPRKFKMAVGVPEDNCVDLYTQDIGVEIVHEGGKLVAYDIIAGGGLGFSHGNEATQPLLGHRLVRCQPQEVMEVIETLFTIQRDFGDRTDRKHARFKYVFKTYGIEWVRDELTRRLGRRLPEAGLPPVYGIEDHLGWHEQADGRWFVGVHIDNGRVYDDAKTTMRTGLRKIVERFRPDVRLTARQDVLFANIEAADKPAVQALMAEHGLETDAQPSPLRRWAMACPALPTCGLALAESERYIPSLIAALEQRGCGSAAVEMRMTGCPNSCVRTTMAEIAIIGRGPKIYTLMAGGNKEGTRLAFDVCEKLKESEVPDAIAALIGAWRAETGESASFGDWSASAGAAKLAELAAPAPAPAAAPAAAGGVTAT